MDKKRLILKAVMIICAAVVLATALKAGDDTENSAPTPPPKATVESVREERGEELISLPEGKTREESRDTAGKGSAENPQQEGGSAEKSAENTAADKDIQIETVGNAANSTEKVGNTEKSDETVRKAQNKENTAEKKGNAVSAAAGTEPRENVCVLSVKCDTALKSEALTASKAAHLPSDGVIYKTTEVEFSDGETVFDVLKRELKANKIHMEFSGSSGLGSMYIEGIANLYEFDCGELSGWMYSVNGEFPKVGCSNVKVKKGDKIEWRYSCDLGADIGGSNF